MSKKGQFVAKVSKTKTRSKGEKNYYTYRINIPHQIVSELDLKNNDYLFIKSSVKAKWYHLFKWNEEPKAWDMLPEKLQQEIRSSGIDELPETNFTLPIVITVNDPWLMKDSVNINNVSGTRLSEQKQVIYVKNN